MLYLKTKKLSLDGTRVTPCRATLMDLQRDSGPGTLQRTVARAPSRGTVAHALSRGTMAWAPSRGTVARPSCSPNAQGFSCCNSRTVSLEAQALSEELPSQTPPQPVPHGMGHMEGGAMRDRTQNAPSGGSHVQATRRKLERGSQYAAVFMPGKGALGICPQDRILW